MFSRQEVDDIFSQLRAEWGYLSKAEWNALAQDAHLAVARAEARVPLGDIDDRVRSIIERRIEPDTSADEQVLGGDRQHEGHG